MASNVFSEIIIFVSVLIITAAVSGNLVTITHKLSLGINNKGEILSSKLSQDFEIINDPANVPRNSTTGITTLYVKNTGKTQIPFNGNVFTVIIDGDIKNIDSTADLNDLNGVLDPSEVGKIDVSYNNTGYHKIKVISEQGVTRTLMAEIQ
ncbi:MAG: archaeal flagellar protein FlaG [Methanothermococcus sp.]|jgi:flagellar protein FlaG|uniref:FlaG n=1 Tax=Methanothermococcus thermolithotrophicus TaxID=2186 RepID=Q9C4P4_METTL|nr:MULTISPECIES: hypothetical protein [Methanothermococcus]AAG50076.1 FlaG [Methanothermococcus thermolithotrophicus]MDK2790262.1 archaeal flagellar protein FlaG [Methanothermococcus sp.]MDK2987734.1 archaeal flagellar protein FlaG [Methanothermococcus sp.]